MIFFERQEEHSKYILFLMFKIWKPTEFFEMIKLNSKKEPKGVILGHILKHFSLFRWKRMKGKPQICPQKKMYNKYDNM